MDPDLCRVGSVPVERISEAPTEPCKAASDFARAVPTSLSANFASVETCDLVFDVLLLDALGGIIETGLANFEVTGATSAPWTSSARLVVESLELRVSSDALETSSCSSVWGALV